MSRLETLQAFGPVPMKLCLHFDINKTIMVADAGSGRDFSASLNSLLSEAVWGEFPAALPKAQRRPEDWIALPCPPGAIPPSASAVTFGAYLEDHTDLSKTERRVAKCSFTNTYGSAYKPNYLTLSDCLTASENSSGCSFLAEGKLQILPSFFRLLDHLVEKAIDFRLIFRTFGVDTPSIAEEFNMYCEGKHPLFHPKHLLDGSHPAYPRDLRLKLPHASGTLRRTGPASSGLHLAYVDRKNVSLLRPSNQPSDLMVLQLVSVASGGSNVFQALMDALFHSVDAVYSMALRDDYAWWDAQNESDESGKVFLVDAQQVHALKAAMDKGLTVPVDEQVVQVFFDDNIERDRAHIVDVRDHRTFEPLPFSLTKHTVLHKVEPYLSITDREYFVKVVDGILSRYC